MKTPSRITESHDTLKLDGQKHAFDLPEASAFFFVGETAVIGAQTTNQAVFCRNSRACSLTRYRQRLQVHHGAVCVGESCQAPARKTEWCSTLQATRRWLCKNTPAHPLPRPASTAICGPPSTQFACGEHQIIPWDRVDNLLLGDARKRFPPN